MAAAEPHGIVDIFNRTCPFFQRANCIEEIRHQQPIHNEARAVFCPDGGFAEFRAKGNNLFINCLVGRDRSHHFNEIHHGHWVEKMQSYRAPRTFGGRRHFGDSQGGRVAGKNRGRRADLIQRRKQFALRRQLFDDGFDNQVGSSQIFQGSGSLQSPASFGFPCFCTRSLLRQPVQVFLNALQSLVDKLCAYFAHYGGESCRRAHLRDA